MMQMTAKKIPMIKVIHSQVVEAAVQLQAMTTIVLMNNHPPKTLNTFYGTATCGEVYPLAAALQAHERKHSLK